MADFLPSDEIARSRANMMGATERFLLESNERAKFFADYEFAIAKADAIVEQGVEQEIALSADPLPDLAIRKMRKVERRKERKKAIKEVLDDHGLTKIPVPVFHAIKATTGLGKTKASIDALAKLSEQGVDLASTDIFEPTRQKCLEVQEDLTAAGKLCVVELGYDSDDPDWDSRGIKLEELTEGMTPYKACVHTEAVKLAGRSGVFIREEFCNNCPFKDRCGKKQNEGTLKTVRDLGGVVIKTHARVDYPSSAGHGLIAIVDEDPSRRGHKIDEIKASDICQEKLRDVLDVKKPQHIAMLDDFCQIIKESIACGFPVKDMHKHHRLMRRMEIALRKATDATRPKLDGDLSIDNVQKQIRFFNVSYAKIAKLSELIRKADRHNLPLAFINRIQHDNPDGTLNDYVYRYRHVKRPKFGRKTSCLFLSATMSMERMRAFIGRDDIVTDEFNVDRNIDIRHVRCKSSTMALSGVGIDRLPLGAHSVQRAIHRRAEIVRRVTSEVPDDGSVLFVTNKTNEDLFYGEVPETFHQAHFGELEGINKYSDCAAIAIVGQAWPAMVEVERQAAAVALLVGQKITTMRAYLKAEAEEGREHEQDMMGYLRSGAGPYHPCPFVRDEIFAKIEADYDQAIGRLRAVNAPAPKKVFIFRDYCPAGFEPTKVEIDQAAPPKIVEMFIAQCIKQRWMPVTSTAIAIAFPSLFKDAKSVKNAMKRATSSRQNPVRMYKDGLVSFPISKESISRESGLCAWSYTFGSQTKRPHVLLAASDMTRQQLIAAIPGVMRLTRMPEHDIARYLGETPDPPKPAKQEDGPNPSTEATILSGHGGHDKLMTKKFSMTRLGKVVLAKTKHPKRFSGHVVHFDSVEAMHSVLLQLSKDPYSYVIRGRPKPDLNMNEIYQRKWRGQEPTFDNVPRSWFMADLDDFRLPMGIEFDPADPGYAIRTVLNALPEPFKGTSCVVQFSSSQGIATTPDQIKVHLWFKLSHSLTQYQMRDLLRAVDEDKLFDEVTTRTVQPHFTAAPVCDGFKDPLDKRVYLFKVAGKDVVQISNDLVEEISKPRPVSMSLLEDEVERGITPHLLDLSIKKIGGENGFHDAVGNCARFAAIAVSAGLLDKDTAVSKISAGVWDADPGGRSRDEIEERASPESIGRWIDWWTENLTS